MRIIKNITRGYYNWLRYIFNKKYRVKIKELASKRIKICESCQFFFKYSRNCMLCGCFCDIKVKSDFKLDHNEISIDGCPERKW